MIKNILVVSVLAGIFSLTSCKQQKINVLPGAVVSQDGTKDGMKNVKGDYEGSVKTSEGVKFTLSSDLLFPSNSSYLTDKAKVELTKLSSILKQEKTKKIRVDGYTDATGTEQYNVWLSDKRAASVKKFLEEAGVAGSRITTKGFGPSNPVGNNKTPEGRQQNRRVEVVILN